MYKFLLLFAHQVDAWSKLAAFCEARMVQESSENSYGPQFEQLGIFIKSSKQTFGWMFILKGGYDSAVIDVTSQAKKRLIGLVASLLLAQIFGRIPEQLGLTDSQSEIIDSLKDLVSGRVDDITAT